MDLRMQFIMRLRDGERMTDLCREFGISRKTGYKFEKRYSKLGASGLVDQSRAPKRSAQRLSEEIAELLIRGRKKNPSWGSKKLKAVLAKRYPELKLPAPSTIDSLLKRRGLVEPRKRRGCTLPYASPLCLATAPNEVWCTDYKGQFRMGDGELCYPLTVTDRFSRHLMGCEGFNRIDTDGAIAAFHRIFVEFGLPSVIRSDNGAPFASRALWGLSRLSVWWLRLGIWHERIEPGCPQQNGQHERMHRDLKRETARPGAANLLAQQERFDGFLEEYNSVRPHEALDMKTPSEVYWLSDRRMPDRLEDPKYPLHDDIVEVDGHGHIRIGKHNIFLSQALARQLLGIRELNDGGWLISFVAYDLGTWLVDQGFRPLPPPGREPQIVTRNASFQPAAGTGTALFLMDSPQTACPQERPAASEMPPPNRMSKPKEDEHSDRT
jgi:putative transposase